MTRIVVDSETLDRLIAAGGKLNVLLLTEATTLPRGPARDRLLEGSDEWYAALKSLRDGDRTVEL